MPMSCTVLATERDLTQEIEVRRSRFLCVLRRVATEDEARELIAEQRRAHHDARHHCSAFVLGPDRMLQRSSDDGEPSGTAGAPMLEALTQHRTAARGGSRGGSRDRSPDGSQSDLTDVCAVVVRWFGGTLLGAGGLVRAYTQAVTAALETAPLVTRVRRRRLEVSVAPALTGKLENELRAAGATVLPTSYGAAEAVLHVAVSDDEDEVARLRSIAAAVTSGAARVTGTGVDWADLL